MLFFISNFHLQKSFKPNRPPTKRRGRKGDRFQEFYIQLLSGMNAMKALNDHSYKVHVGPTTDNHTKYDI
jgi:hypothetical protein